MVPDVALTPQQGAGEALVQRCGSAAGAGDCQLVARATSQGAGTGRVITHSCAVPQSCAVPYICAVPHSCAALWPCCAPLCAMPRGWHWGWHRSCCSRVA